MTYQQYMPTSIPFWDDIAEDRVSFFLDQLTPAQLPILAAGREVRYGDEWYMRLRIKPQPRPDSPAQTVRAACGHTISRGLLMSASTGTSCPDCYDRMSGEG